MLQQEVIADFTEELYQNCIGTCMNHNEIWWEKLKIDKSIRLSIITNHG